MGQRYNLRCKAGAASSGLADTLSLQDVLSKDALAVTQVVQRILLEVSGEGKNHVSHI
jgi:hypothetical protein